jgi:ABC-type Zn uptake system ZnuABC Zn-binding protein ZnuA
MGVFSRTNTDGHGLTRTLTHTLLTLGLVCCACLAWGEESRVVVAGSSQIGDVVKAVAGDGVSVVTLVPPTMCPGQYDAKPSEIEGLKGAACVLGFLRFSSRGC